jgi:predicted CoA-binding protein
MDERARIDDFLAGGPYAVVGASRDRRKYGNKVLRAYLQRGLAVHVAHPRELEIEGVRAVPSLAALPERVRGLSIITPPEVTERIVVEAAQVGIRRLWMQPGAESEEAVASAAGLGLEVIAGGPCILVLLGFRDV